MGILKRCFLLMALALMGLSTTTPASAATQQTPPDVLRASAPSPDVDAVVLTCFTIKPVDPPKGKAPRSCDTYCAEQQAVCTGVQSNIGPPPACEDGMFTGYGNCRCCKVRP